MSAPTRAERRCPPARRRRPRRAAWRPARPRRAARPRRSERRRTPRAARGSETPGSSSRPATSRSRRAWNSSSIAPTASCGPCERGDAGVLDERRHARGRVHEEARQRLDERAPGTARVAAAPARHRVRLREAVEQRRCARASRGRSRSRRTRRRTAGASRPRRTAPTRCVASIARGGGLERRRAATTPPVGLCGRVEDHELRARAQARPQLVEVEGEVARPRAAAAAPASPPAQRIADS